MCYDNYLKLKFPAIILIALIFTSCGSYQYVGTDNDGIYDSTYDNVEYVEVTEEKNNSSSDYYQNYFKEKRNEYDAIAQESEIFTDVDSYSSENYTEQDSIDNSYRGYSGWGQANENVTINIYDNGWNNWGWNAGIGWGWNNWRWNRWYRPWGWNVGFGWGWNNWGWYDPFWCPPYYNAWGWGNFGNPYWNNGYYGRSVAYNAGRRGSYLDSGRSTLSRRSNLVNSRNLTTPIRTRSTLRSTTPRRNSTLSNSTRTRNNIRTRNNSSISTPRSTRSTRNNSSIRSSNTRSSSPSRVSSPSRSSSSGGRSISSGSSRSGRRR